MKIPRYWVAIEADVFVDGQRQPSRFLGSSEHSEAEAREQAAMRVSQVQARINSNDGRRAEDYEVAIREEIVEELRSDAVVTRNRYGAEVLNCARLVMIDVDRAPDPGFWRSLFGRDKRTPKQRMFDHIRAAAVSMDQRLGYRIYETHNGYRVIVTGRDMAPTDATVKAMFKAMNCDPLYAMLCRKQDCYRARLTPKPSRIKQPSIRLRFPYEPALSEALTEWLPQYQGRRTRYAVCKLVEVIGHDDPDRIVRYHDERTGCFTELPLA